MSLRAWRRPLRIIAIIAFLAVLAYFVYVALVGFPESPRLDPETGEVIQETTRLGPWQALRAFGEGFPRFIAAILPLLFQGLFLLSFVVLQFVVMFWFLSRGRRYILYPNEMDIRFDDVRGQRAVVDSTRDVLRLFRAYKEFRKLGGYPPHGILFEGPPGTGKTLLGKAIAGEAGVPFMYCSGTGFQNMFFGMSAMTVSSFFRKARRLADGYGGVVVFIDEIDALGSRGPGMSMARTGRGETAVAPPEARWWWQVRKIVMGGFGGGGGDRSMLNEILTQLDGMEGAMPKKGLRRTLRRMFGMKPKKRRQHYNIMLIGATNMASALDPALLRPGRFDRKIHVGRPTKDGRIDIARYYLDKVRHEPIDLDKLANATVHYSPAEIKDVINEALIFAVSEGREALTYADIWQAKLTNEIGLKQAVTYTPWEREATAIHEAGHAVAAWFLRPHETVQVITIQNRGSTLGLVHSMEVEERFSETRSEMVADIKVSLAGMGAERLWYGDTTSGPTSDLINATRRAARMVAYFGMGSTLMSAGAIPFENYDGDELREILRDDRVRAEIDGILQHSMDDVLDLLRRKAHCVEALRDLLLQKEIVTGEEFELLLERLGEGMRLAHTAQYRPPAKALAEEEGLAAAVPAAVAGVVNGSASGTVNGGTAAATGPVAWTPPPPPVPPVPPGWQEQPGSAAPPPQPPAGYRAPDDRPTNGQ